MNFYETIHNSCFDCGRPCEGVYASNRDEARSGGGRCKACAFPEPAPEPEPESGDIINATDAARKLAQKAGVDLGDVQAAMAEPGRVGQPDVAAYLKAIKPEGDQ
jgi:pyruvate/2-oxoglutarate dehydrogenase complex dihydrolipoamide acyltransferase (E2) component